MFVFCGLSKGHKNLPEYCQSFSCLSIKVPTLKRGDGDGAL